MAFGILQTFWKRLSQYKNIDQIVIENFLMNQVEMEKDKPVLYQKEIREFERPPMIEVAGYRKKRGLPPLKAKSKGQSKGKPLGRAGGKPAAKSAGKPEGKTGLKAGLKGSGKSRSLTGKVGKNTGGKVGPQRKR